MAPVYGLAESSVGLAFPPFGRMPVIDRIKRDQLSIHGIAEAAGPTTRPCSRSRLAASRSWP